MKKHIACVLAVLCSAASFQAWAGGSADAGKAAVEKFGCAACHGKDFNTPIDPTYPKLAGQHQDYLAHALIAYQRGADVLNGRSNAIMNGQAKPLSKQDIQNIAAYLHSLPGSLVLRK
ncbi:MAG TPA: cytochrome c [Paucimonas sp.]|nr:cytochrome c [Paucimonas sp.]HJW56216.1 cytochrome c [Burkholderiaceae bacterium]